MVGRCWTKRRGGPNRCQGDPYPYFPIYFWCHCITCEWNEWHNWCPYVILWACCSLKVLWPLLFIISSKVFGIVEYYWWMEDHKEFVLLCLVMLHALGTCMHCEDNRSCEYLLRIFCIYPITYCWLVSWFAPVLVTTPLCGFLGTIVGLSLRASKLLIQPSYSMSCNYVVNCSQNRGWKLSLRWSCPS
jgi:hypothetical protein